MTRDEALKLTPAQWRKHVLKTTEAALIKAETSQKPEDVFAAINAILATCDILIDPHKRRNQVNYDAWKTTEPDDGAEPPAEDDGREAWLSGVIDRIKTERDEVAPSRWGWTATVGDYDLDDPIGHGASEAEAISDLLEQLEP